MIHEGSLVRRKRKWVINVTSLHPPLYIPTHSSCCHSCSHLISLKAVDPEWYTVKTGWNASIELKFEGIAEEPGSTEIFQHWGSTAHIVCMVAACFQLRFVQSLINRRWKEPCCLLMLHSEKHCQCVGALGWVMDASETWRWICDWVCGCVMTDCIIA